MATTVKVKHNNVRMAPRKVKLVIDAISGMTVVDSESQLEHMNKRASRTVLRLIRSATANAKSVYDLDREQLYVKKIVANQGPTLKRFTPRAFGRATPINKRTTHIVLELGVAKDIDDKSIKKVAKHVPEAPTIVTGVREHERRMTEKEWQRDKSDVPSDIDKTEQHERGVLQADKTNVQSGVQQKKSDLVQEKPGDKKAASTHKRGFIKKFFLRKTG